MIHFEQTGPAAEGFACPSMIANPPMTEVVRNAAQTSLLGSVRDMILTSQFSIDA
jgi:hypothetical protein